MTNLQLTIGILAIIVPFVVAVLGGFWVLMRESRKAGKREQKLNGINDKLVLIKDDMKGIKDGHQVHGQHIVQLQEVTKHIASDVRGLKRRAGFDSSHEFNNEE